MLIGLLSGLGYVGLNAAAYVATGHNQAKNETKGKAPGNPFLKFVLGCIFWPAMLLRAVLPVVGTQNWRAQFRKKVKAQQDKFLTRDCGPSKTRTVDLQPADKAKVEQLIKEGKYKEAFMALNKNLSEDQAMTMANQFAKYVKRYRVPTEAITVEKMLDLATDPTKEVEFSSNSSFKNMAPKLSGKGLYARCNDELYIVDQNRARMLEFREVLKSNKKISKEVRKYLTKMLDDAQELYINNHSVDFDKIHGEVRALLGTEGLTLDNPEIKRIEGLIYAQENFKAKYNTGMYETMDVAAQRTAAKEPTSLDDKEKLLIELNAKFGKKIANEYYEDYQNSVTEADKGLASTAISTYEADHTPTVEKTLNSLTKLVVLNQYREATKGKSKEEAKTIAQSMGITEELLNDELFNNQDIYDHVKANELDIIVQLELAKKHGSAEVPTLEAARNQMFDEKFAAIATKMGEDFEGKPECEEMLKHIKEIDMNVDPVQLLLELTQLEIVIDQAMARERDVDLSVEKAQAIAQLKERYNNDIVKMLKTEEIPAVEAALQVFYDSINGAKTLAEINAEVVKANKYLDKISMTLEEYKNQAMEELKAYANVEGLDPEVAEKVKAAMDAGLEAIRKCTTKQEVDEELAAAKAAIDKEKVRTEEPEITDKDREDAYNDVVAALEAVKGELTPEAAGTTDKLLEDAKAALFADDIKTKEALEAVKNTWIEKVNALEKKKPVDLTPLKERAIQELSDFYSGFRGTLDSIDIIEADKKIGEYKDAIRNATSEEEINAKLAEGKDYIMGLTVSLSQYKEDLKQKLTEYAALDSIADESKRLEVSTLLNEGLADISMATSKAEAQKYFETAKVAIDQAKNRNKEDEVTKEDRDAAYQEIVKAYEEIKETLSDKGRDEGTALLANAEKAIYSPFVYKKEEIAAAKAEYIAQIKALEKKKENELTQADRDAAYQEIENAIDAARPELSDKGNVDADRLLFDAETAIKAATTKEELQLIKNTYLSRIEGLERDLKNQITQADRDRAYEEVEASLENSKDGLTEKGYEDGKNILKEARDALNDPNIKTIEDLDKVRATYIEKMYGLEKKPELTQEEKDAAYEAVENAVEAIKAELSEKGLADAEILLAEAKAAINAATTKEELEAEKNAALEMVKDLEKKPELTQEEKDAAYETVKNAVEAIKAELSEKGLADAETLLAEAKEAINAATTKEELEAAKTEALGKVNGLEKKPELTQEEKDAAYKAVENAVEAIKAELSEKGLADAETLLNEAKEAINAATTKEELEAAKNAALGKVNGLEKKPELTQEEKDAAYEDVKNAVEAIKAELSEKGLADAETLLNEAKEAINAATTKEELNAAKDAALGKVNGLEKKPDLTQPKHEAIQAVSKAILEASSELTKKGLASAQGVQARAEAAINAADTLEAIAAARDAAIAEVANLERKPSQQVKDTYITKVEEEYNTYKAKIEEAERSSGNSYGGKKSVMTKALNAAKEAINKAESVEELEAAVAKAVDVFKTQIVKAQSEQCVTIVTELDGKTTTLVARNKGGVTKVSIGSDLKFTISPAVQDLTSEASKQRIKEEAEKHRAKVIENTKGVEGEIKP